MPAPSASVRDTTAGAIARAATALVGGYVAASAAAALLARVLPVARAEAATWGVLLSYPLYAAILLWCYAGRTYVRVAATVWGIAAACGGLLALLGARP